MNLRSFWGSLRWSDLLAVAERGWPAPKRLTTTGVLWEPERALLMFFLDRLIRDWGLAECGATKDLTVRKRGPLTLGATPSSIMHRSTCRLILGPLETSSHDMAEHRTSRVSLESSRLSRPVDRALSQDLKAEPSRSSRAVVVECGVELFWGYLLKTVAPELMRNLVRSTVWSPWMTENERRDWSVRLSRALRSTVRGLKKQRKLANETRVLCGCFESGVFSTSPEKNHQGWKNSLGNEVGDPKTSQQEHE